MKWCMLFVAALCLPGEVEAWGFFAHRLINRHAVFLLPPEMMVFYKRNIDFITEHAVDPDKRRYAIEAEGPRHYIDLDRYPKAVFDGGKVGFEKACETFGTDSVLSRGIVPWWIQIMLHRLTAAFRANDVKKILKYSAEIGHYIGDAHVPLHTTGNHNGQLTKQHGIHGFWESRIPELLAEKEWDFWIGSASFLKNPLAFSWKIVLQSGAAADTVLALERELNLRFPAGSKYAYESRNGVLTRQYSEQYTIAYNRALKGMVEKRFRQSVAAVASFWYTAWINAGQPDLRMIADAGHDPGLEDEFELLNRSWRQGKVLGKSCD